MKLRMDNGQGEWQDGAGFELRAVPVKASGSSHNLLSHRHMDTLHWCGSWAGAGAIATSQTADGGQGRVLFFVFFCLYAWRVCVSFGSRLLDQAGSN